MKKLFLLAALLLCVHAAQAQNRWSINNDGGITWSVKEGDSHFDQIEMSGEKMSTVLRWGVKPSGEFSLERSLIFPMLRTVPNNTHASLMQRIATDIPSMLIVNGRTLNSEKVEAVTLDGKMSVVSKFAAATYDVGKEVQPKPTMIAEMERVITPSTTNATLNEKYTIKNLTNRVMLVTVPELNTVYNTLAKNGVKGSYTISHKIVGSGSYEIKPNGTLSFTSYIEALDSDDKPSITTVDKEIENRDAFVNQMWTTLVLDTPDDNINKMFAFAKIRAAESIFRTEGGLMHSPGGESYYAAIWANDQAEYINPFFPYLGYNVGNESAINSYKHFARFMNDDYNPIPSSIIAEGKDIWNGAGDRGDAAMIAYGASRYALTMSSKKEAEELWPLIEWCLEYCDRKKNDDGVIASDRDELEGRFPSGDANLCTSTLYYDALLSSSYLAKELGKSGSVSSKYQKQAKALKVAIENHFGANVEGYDTYQYYEGNDILRSWICMPLTVDIFDRTDETIKALFSDRLWTEDGLLTQAGTETFWDRSTLYALRGVYASSHPNIATDFLKKYSQKRLLGNHVPYAIEAYPEGGQRHLSAESALYCRIFTEGLFGIRPTGFNSFNLTPQLPTEWDHIALNDIKAFGTTFSIKVSRIDNNKNKVEIVIDGKTVKTLSLKAGATCKIAL